MEATHTGPYQYKWTAKDDPRHTISNLESVKSVDGFVRQNRAGTPWRVLEQDTGRVVLEGVGNEFPWWQV